MVCLKVYPNEFVKKESATGESWVIPLKNRFEELITFSQFTTSSINFIDRITGDRYTASGTLSAYPSSSYYNAQYQWASGDTSLATGSYMMMVTMTSGSQTYVFPQDEEQFLFRIIED